MEPTEALNIIKQACASLMGTLKDHQTVQAAIQAIEDHISAPDTAAPSKTSDKSSK